MDEAAIERLRRAAEEVAWLTGRGYRLEDVDALVSRHHGLSDEERSLLVVGTCSEPQYRRRAARELEAEDVARKPLAIDAVGALTAIEAALEGQPVLQTLDGSVRAASTRTRDDAFRVGPRTDDALVRLLTELKSLRPSMARLVVEDAVAGAAELRDLVAKRAKERGVKAQVVLVPELRAALRREPHVASADAEVLDACGAWFNLVGRVVTSVPGARLVRLQ